jgi:hypothetical protein
MTPKIARLLAGIVLDDWPVPAWLRTKIEANPDVSRALCDGRGLENRLREQAEALDEDHRRDSRDYREPYESTHRLTWLHGPSRSLLLTALATAALLLVSIGIWQWNQRETGGNRSDVIVMAPVDVRPVLASLAAGQQVANNLSDGFRKMGTQIAQAGGRFGAQFMWRDRSLDQDSGVPSDSDASPDKQ